MPARVAIVTGASSGLGRALAYELAANGYAVGMIARRESMLRIIDDELQTAGRRSTYAAADVTDRDGIEAAVARITATLGAVDLVIANAGVRIPECLDPFDHQVVEQTFAVNLMGVVNTVGAVLPEMLQRGSGHIVGISSLGADRGFPGSAAYAASKAALSIYLEGLRVALKRRGIVVTTVSPGFLRTDMTADGRFPMPFLLEPEEAARRIVRSLPKRRAVYRFPLMTSWMMRILRQMPDRVIARLVPPK